LHPGEILVGCGVARHKITTIAIPAYQSSVQVRALLSSVFCLIAGCSMPLRVLVPGGIVCGRVTGCNRRGSDHFRLVCAGKVHGGAVVRQVGNPLSSCEESLAHRARSAVAAGVAAVLGD
jgi:hypothetical protein